MPKAQPKGETEKIAPEEILIDIGDVKTQDGKPQVILVRSQPKEIAPEKISATLAEMKTNGSIIGYVLQRDRAVSLELNDPTKLTDYAILSTWAKEAGQELSQTFDLGKIENMLIDGKNVKLLSITVGENDISIFMKNAVDHVKIYKTIISIA
jgi:predicted regulator of Ras-like GTPase activity (Roadblock/LC7/MglB family)